MHDAENMPSGKAVKPGDVLVAKNGKTVEVTFSSESVTNSNDALYLGR